MKLKEQFCSLTYGTFAYNWCYWWKYKCWLSPKWHLFHNPWYHWWKVRDIFKRPKLKLISTHSDFCTFGLPMKNKKVKFRIECSSLGWKDKWNSPRHEWNPYICIDFFKWRWTFMVGWDYTFDDHVWEAILNLLYYKGKLNDDFIISNTWYTYCWVDKVNDEGKKVVDWEKTKKVPTTDLRNYLTKKYYNQFKHIDLYEECNKPSKSKLEQSMAGASQ